MRIITLASHDGRASSRPLAEILVGNLPVTTLIPFVRLFITLSVVFIPGMFYVSRGIATL